MTEWRDVRDLPAPANDQYEMVEDREYPLTLASSDCPVVMRRHRGKLQVRRK